MAGDTILTYSDYRDDPSPLIADCTLPYADWLGAIWKAWQVEDLPADTEDAGAAPVFVNSGRWLWYCPGCLTSYPVEPGERGLCGMCGAGWFTVTMPADRDAIDAELLKQPGHRAFAPVRAWMPEWGMDVLEARTARAEELKAQGISPIRRLSLSTPHMFVANAVLLASQLNSNRAVLQELAGSDGRVDVEAAMRVAAGATHGTQPYLDLAPSFVGLPVVSTDPTQSDGQLFYRSDTNRVRYGTDGGFANVPVTPIPVTEGGTGATTAENGRAALKIVTISQSDYDDLATPDATTIYVIT